MSLSDNVGHIQGPALRKVKPVRRTQAERSAETQAKILAATITCIDKLGYGNTTFRRVAREAGITVGAVQHYYLSKTELLMAVIDSGFADLAQRLDDTSFKHGSLEERIDGFVDHMWEHCASPTYQSNIQILFGLQHEKRTGDATWLDLPLTKFSLRARDMWMEIFATTGLSENAHAELLHYVFASISGSAQLFRVSKLQRRVNSDLRLLKKLIFNTFTEVAAKNSLPASS